MSSLRVAVGITKSPQNETSVTSLVKLARFPWRNPITFDTTAKPGPIRRAPNLAAAAAVAGMDRVHTHTPSDWRGPRTCTRAKKSISRTPCRRLDPPTDRCELNGAENTQRNRGSKSARNAPTRRAPKISQRHAAMCTPTPSSWPSSSCLRTHARQCATAATVAPAPRCQADRPEKHPGNALAEPPPRFGGRFAECGPPSRGRFLGGTDGQVVFLFGEIMRG